MTLAPLQLPLYRFPQEVGLPLVLFKGFFDAFQRPFRETGAGLLVVDLGASSGHGHHNRCYHKLLQAPFLLLASIASSRIVAIINSSERETDMTYRAHIEGFTGHFNTCGEMQVWAEDLNRRYSLKGCVLKVWKAVWVARDGSGAQYNAIPTREIVVGA